jgi:hypothetical protein
MPKGKKPPRAKGTRGKEPRDIGLVEMVEADAGERTPDGGEDEDLLEINFSFGNPVSKGIPWDDYTELEIQTLLKMHFEMMGYETTWRHRDDPANEKGIDLEFNRKSDGRRVLVAVKKYPKKEALAQIVELADHEANERIYVYAGGAAQSFRDKLGNFSSKVQFWNERELESKLDATGTTLQLRVANSKTDEAMFRIMAHILTWIKMKPPTRVSAKPSVETLETLWGMKDRAVTVNKCAGMAQLMLEDPSRFGQSSNEQIQSLVMYLLDYLYVYGLRSLEQTIEELSPELQALLYEVHKKTEIRSNWLELYQYRPGPTPSRVERFHQGFERDQAKWKETERVIKSVTRKEPSEMAESTLAEDASNLFRSLGIWAHGLEATIDDLYERCVRGSVPE